MPFGIAHVGLGLERTRSRCILGAGEHRVGGPLARKSDIVDRSPLGVSALRRRLYR